MMNWPSVSSRSPPGSCRIRPPVLWSPGRRSPPGTTRPWNKCPDSKQSLPQSLVVLVQVLHSPCCGSRYPGHGPGAAAGWRRCPPWCWILGLNLDPGGSESGSDLKSWQSVTPGRAAPTTLNKQVSLPLIAFKIKALCCSANVSERWL